MLMRVATAMLPDARSSQDRIFTTQNAVIILDGASAFVPVKVSPTTYVDTLGRLLVEGLAAEPEGQLTDLLAQAIEESVFLLDLQPGSSPSSTVAIARIRTGEVDLLVLGDTAIATPSGVVIDNRLSTIAEEERQDYRARLLNGWGYDKTHAELLRKLQAEQARYRNVAGGYWIAEATPDASAHALCSTLPLTANSWLVLATDGAYRPLLHLGREDWSSIATRDERELHDLLLEIESWEATADPNGIAHPRAKRHDDKAIATVADFGGGPFARDALVSS
ncbi:hypothetical protein [Cellulosimicrobium cellulans]|uniref:hypothetical protein n=1 Tax=Cellulosimicrobium cellulans TaxID=1710 RepID=UPI0028AD9B50|nr:hypothetical protein [Cellulosimicrobium cellulans]